MTNDNTFAIKASSPPSPRVIGVVWVLYFVTGGLGAPVLLYLAAAGVGTIGIVDDDHVSLSNLQRQIAHRTADVGRAKTESAADAIHAINFSGPGKTKCVAVRRCSQDTNHALGSAKFASRYVSNCFVSSFGVDTANP